MKPRYLIPLLILTLSNNCFASEPQPSHKTEKAMSTDKAMEICNAGVDNFYRVSNDLYRSKQPNRKGFCNLKKMGIQSVLNLREHHTDNKKANGLNLDLYSHKMAAGSITENDIEECLRIIKNAPKPILIHCWHGSDRTGTIVAAYRIVMQDWSPDDAIAELKEPRFGYHSKTYPNIPELLKSINWKGMKKRLDKR